MNRRVGLVVAALAVSVGLLASACDGGEDPTDPPTSTTSESGTATESSTTDEPTDVVTPPEVEAPTPAPEVTTNDHVGAIWAAKYFIDLYAYMYATGDTSRFEAMSAPECEFCASAVGAASELHEAGGWVEGGAISFDVSEATAEYPTADQSSYVVRFAAEEAPSTTHHADGTEEELDGSTFDSAIAIQYVDQRFVVFGVNTE